MQRPECSFEMTPLAAVLRTHCWAGRGGSREMDYCNNPTRRYDGLDQDGNGGGGETWLYPGSIEGSSIEGRVTGFADGICYHV